MKAQLIFEFLIAGIIFFGVVVYAINTMNTNVADFRSRSYIDRLNSKAIKISEILASNSGLAPEWPVFDYEKINEFRGDCNQNYHNLRKKFDLDDTTTYGVVIPHYFRVYINTTTEEFYCGPDVPANVSKAEVIRKGIVYDSNVGVYNFLTMTVWVW
jgi:hypothetical protein